VISAIDTAAVQPDLEALADATADPDGAADEIRQLMTRVVEGLRVGVPMPDAGVDDDDPDAWVAADNSGEYVVVGPEFMLTADGNATSATIINGPMTWTLCASATDDRSWRVTALHGGEVAVDVTLVDGAEIDHRDTDALNDEIERQMQEIVDHAVDHESQIFDAAESGQSTTASADGPLDVGSTASPVAASSTDEGGPGVGTVVAGTLATIATGAVVSRARRVLSARSPENAAPAAPPATPVWRRTHVVPAAGMSAWSIPDGSVAPVATLAAGVELELAQVQGPWAEVVGSNGWRGWVDVSLLVPAPQ
jgi:hypothetical protein